MVGGLIPNEVSRACHAFGGGAAATAPAAAGGPSSSPSSSSSSSSSPPPGGPSSSESSDSSSWSFAAIPATGSPFMSASAAGFLSSPSFSLESATCLRDLGGLPLTEGFLGEIAATPAVILDSAMPVRSVELPVLLWWSLGLLLAEASLSADPGSATGLAAAAAMLR